MYLIVILRSSCVLIIRNITPLNNVFSPFQIDINISVYLLITTICLAIVQGDYQKESTSKNKNTLILGNTRISVNQTLNSSLICSWNNLGLQFRNECMQKDYGKLNVTGYPEKVNFNSLSFFFFCQYDKTPHQKQLKGERLLWFTVAGYDLLWEGNHRGRILKQLVTRHPIRSGERWMHACSSVPFLHLKTLWPRQ